MNTNEAVSLFLSSRVKRRPLTIDWYTDCLKRFTAFYLEIPTRPEGIDAFLNSLECGDERVHGYFRAIRAMYHFLERRRYIQISDNPIRMMDPPRVSPKEPRPLPLEDVARLLNYPHESKLMAALLFIAATGCRLDEARSLDKEALLETPYGPIAKVKGKRGQRGVPVTWEVYRSVKAALPFSWTTDQLGRLISQAFKAAGVKGTAINLRHTFGTYWEGEDMALQRIMGHSSLATTKRYRQIRMSYLFAQYNAHAPLLPLLNQTQRML